jgi:CMP-N,N'-diacetyllegionaminic acid synthase
VASLGVVVARGQSKRLPRKMVRPLAGHPLVAYMIRAALASGLDRVILSTDDDEIAAAGKDYGIEAPFRRPAELATDFATNDRVVLHALDWVEANERRAYATVVLLQPTAPFTSANDIDECIETLNKTNANCCFTAAPVSEQPHWMFVPQKSGEVDLLMPGHLSGDRQHTQKLPRYLHPSGAVWAVRAKALRETGRVYCAPMRVAEVAPERAIDIDTELDLVLAEAAARHFGLALAEPRRRVA